MEEFELKSVVLLICFYNISCSWNLIQKLLDGDSGRKSKQRVGFKSSMILDIKPMSDGRVQHRSPSLFLSLMFKMTLECACVCLHYNVEIL